jgi:zinc finger protein 830
MADVRSLLKNERASRRIQHKYASYSTTGTLLCTVCHLQLKSETLWEGHLRSAGHLMHQQKLQEQENRPAPSVSTEPHPIPSKKRKASDEEEGTIRKRSKVPNGLPEGFFEGGQVENSSAAFPADMQIPSRPATPLKPTEAMTILQSEGQVDEHEWAAFESDIANAEAQVQAANDAVISAPAMSTAELAKKSAEEDYALNKKRHEAELEGDREDAARKMEEELEEMESLEARVRRLREKREELRRRGSNMSSGRPLVQASVVDTFDEEDDDEEDDEWDGWMKS